MYAYVGGNPVSNIDPLGFFGFGYVTGGSVELGNYGAVQAGSGAGVFLPFGGISLEGGAFTYSGGFAGSNADCNNRQNNQYAYGAAAGFSHGLFLTNADQATDLKGPFDTRNYNLLFFSIQYAVSGDVSFFSISGGPSAPLAGYSRYPVTTTSTTGR